MKLGLGKKEKVSLIKIFFEAAIQGWKQRNLPTNDVTNFENILNIYEEETVPTIIWLTIGVLIIMANITTRAIEFLTVLKEEYYKRFGNGLPTTTIEAAKPKKKALKILEADRKDRDLFRTFHKEVVRPEYKSPQCQSPPQGEKIFKKKVVKRHRTLEKVLEKYASKL